MANEADSNPGRHTPERTDVDRPPEMQMGAGAAMLLLGWVLGRRRPRAKQRRR